MAENEKDKASAAGGGAPSPAAPPAASAAVAEPRMSAGARLNHVRVLMTNVRAAVARVEGQCSIVLGDAAGAKIDQAKAGYELAKKIAEPLVDLGQKLTELMADAPKNEDTAHSLAEELRGQLTFAAEMLERSKQAVVNPASVLPANWQPPAPAQPRVRERLLSVYLDGEPGQVLKIDENCTLKCAERTRVTASELRQLSNRIKVLVLLPQPLLGEPTYFATNNMAKV